MCFCIPPDDSCLFRYQDIPRVFPQLAWAVPVDMVELGASLEAFADTLPQINTLRLIHRFRHSGLSRLPQELIENVADSVHKQRYESIRKAWKRDWMCFLRICQVSDHYRTYGDHVEGKWHDIFVVDGQIAQYQPKGISETNCTKLQKLEMLQEWFCTADEEAVEKYFFTPWDDQDEMIEHDRATQHWLDRTCQCVSSGGGQPGAEGAFRELNKICGLYFGLEVKIYHEILSPDFEEFLPPHPISNYIYHTRCFLAISPSLSSQSDFTLAMRPRRDSDFFIGDEMLDCHEVDLKRLMLKEGLQTRFKKAMSILGIDVSYHLSELEAHLQHPLRDKELIYLCSCARGHKQDYDFDSALAVEEGSRTEEIEKFLNKKSKELAKSSRPKLTPFSSQ